MYKPRNKIKLNFRLSGEIQQKFTRADTLGDEYTAERIAEQIKKIHKAHAIIERFDEKKKSALVTTLKTEPTAAVSALTTPPSEHEHLITDMIRSRMQERGITTQAPAPKPTHSVATAFQKEKRCCHRQL